MTAELQHLEDIQQFARQVREGFGDKLIRKPITGGLRILAHEMKARAPRSKRKRRGRRSKAAPGAPRRRRLYQAHGQRFKGGKKPVAKAGVNVAKKRAQRAPHAHLVGAGTAERRTKSGANRGRVRANLYIPQAVTAKADQALEHVSEGIWQGIIQLAAANGGTT